MEARDQRDYAAGWTFVLDRQEVYKAEGERFLRAVVAELEGRGFVAEPYARGIADALNVLAAEVHDQQEATA